MSLEKQNYFISQTRWDEFQMAIYFANVTLEDENARQIEVDDYLENKVLHGMKISFKDLNVEDELVFFVKGEKLIGIYKRSEVCYKAERVWN